MDLSSSSSSPSDQSYTFTFRDVDQALSFDIQCLPGQLQMIDAAMSGSAQQDASSFTFVKGGGGAAELQGPHELPLPPALAHCTLHDFRALGALIGQTETQAVFDIPFYPKRLQTLTDYLGYADTLGFAQQMDILCSFFVRGEKPEEPSAHFARNMFRILAASGHFDPDCDFNTNPSFTRNLRLQASLYLQQALTDGDDDSAAITLTQIYRSIGLQGVCVPSPFRSTPVTAQELQIPPSILEYALGGDGEGGAPHPHHPRICIAGGAAVYAACGGEEGRWWTRALPSSDVDVFLLATGEEKEDEDDDATISTLLRLLREAGYLIFRTGRATCTAVAPNAELRNVQLIRAAADVRTPEQLVGGFDMNHVRGFLGPSGRPRLSMCAMESLLQRQFMATVKLIRHVRMHKAKLLGFAVAGVGGEEENSSEEKKDDRQLSVLQARTVVQLPSLTREACILVLETLTQGPFVPESVRSLELRAFNSRREEGGDGGDGYLRSRGVSSINECVRVLEFQDDQVLQQMIRGSLVVGDKIRKDGSFFWTVSCGVTFWLPSLVIPFPTLFSVDEFGMCQSAEEQGCRFGERPLKKLSHLTGEHFKWWKQMEAELFAELQLYLRGVKHFPPLSEGNVFQDIRVHFDPNESRVFERDRFPVQKRKFIIPKGACVEVKLRLDLFYTFQANSYLRFCVDEMYLKT